MRKIALVLLGLLTLTAPTIAQSTNITRFFSVYATESLTIDATAGGIGFTATKTKQTTTPFFRAELVSFRVECSTITPCPIRFTIDGTTVTASIGTILNEGDVLNIYNYDNIKSFKAIRTGANSAIIQPNYYR